MNKIGNVALSLIFGIYGIVISQILSCIDIDSIIELLLSMMIIVILFTLSSIKFPYNRRFIDHALYIIILNILILCIQYYKYLLILEVVYWIYVIEFILICTYISGIMTNSED